jgi:glyoxylase-like metal-dependent hydrolase (beta-lactamase superfamily II)
MIKTMKPRSLILASFVFFLGLLSRAGIQQAQQAPPAQPPQYQQQPAPMTMEKITEHVYQVKGGSGANCGVIIGDKEIMVIDAKMSEDSASLMLAEIRKISPLPVGTLVFTHSDGDHVNGITGFPADIKIIAHEETKRYMDEAFKDEKQRAYLPRIKSFGSAVYEYGLGGLKIELRYFGPAHTSGDVVVFCPGEKVAIMGDLIFIGRDPLVHRHKNGNSFGLVKVLKETLNLGAEVLLSGHADKATRADVEAMIKSLEDKQSRIQTMTGQGKSLADIKAFYKIEDRPAQPGRPRFLSLPEVIYLELTQKNNYQLRYGTSGRATGFATR